MILSKEDFVRLINRIKRLCEAQEELSGWQRKYSDGWAGFPTLQDELIDLLDKILHPADKPGDDVEYFIYELNFGIEWKTGCVTDENGNDIPMGTAEDVYDYLESLWK